MQPLVFEAQSSAIQQPTIWALSSALKYLRAASNHRKPQVRMSVHPQVVHLIGSMKCDCTHA